MPRKKKESKGGKASPGIISRLTSGVVSKPADDITTPEPPPMSVRQLAEKRVADASTTQREAHAEIAEIDRQVGIEAEEADAEKVRLRRLWPEGAELPRLYQKRMRVPCPKCRRVYTDRDGLACIVISSGNQKRKDDRGPIVRIAYFTCRVCDHRFKMVRED